MLLSNEYLPGISVWRGAFVCCLLHLKHDDRNLRCFQLLNLHVVGVVHNVLDGCGQTCIVLQLDDAVVLQQKQRTGFVGGVVRHRDHIAVGNVAEGSLGARIDAEGLIVDARYGHEMSALFRVKVSRVKDEVAFVVLNGNYALEAGFSVAHDAVAYETSASTAAKTYVNVLVVKEGNENNEGIQALAKVLKSDEIKQFIIDTYDGAVVPFED